MNKKKILFLITKDDVGGAQKYVNDLRAYLDRQKFTVKILTGGKGGVHFLSNAFYPQFLFLNDVAALVELIIKFWREKPDVVHLNSSKAGVIGAFAAKIIGIPKVVFTAHGWVFNPDNRLSFWRRWLYRFFHRIASKFQDVIINVSEYDRQLAVRYDIAPSKKLLTVYNGISDVAFLNKKDARRALKTISGHPVSLDGTWIGSIGRLVVEKDYATLIEAAALVKNATFFILGSGSEYRKLKSKSEKLKIADRVCILEDMAPAAPYLKAFDIFILSSIKEGLPYTMLEAMAAELPIVVTRVGGMTEIIEGRGLVMPPREPEELARAINYFIENPSEAKKMAVAAHNFLEDQLSLDKMIRETQKIYLA